MTDADIIFERFPDFIREYIYSHSWDSLRAVQVAAAKTIFETENNLLLTSSTASGKTEAAFFPILSLLHEDPSPNRHALTSMFSIYISFQGCSPVIYTFL